MANCWDMYGEYCRFEPRYENARLTANELDFLERYDRPDDINESVERFVGGKKKYIGDICVKCGTWSRRPER